MVEWLNGIGFSISKSIVTFSHHQKLSIPKLYGTVLTYVKDGIDDRVPCCEASIQALQAPELSLCRMSDGHGDQLTYNNILNLHQTRAVDVDAI